MIITIVVVIRRKKKAKILVEMMKNQKKMKKSWGKIKNLKEEKINKIVKKQIIRQKLMLFIKIC